MAHIISSVKENNSAQTIGGKAKTLIELTDYGFNVPDFFVLSSDVENIDLIKDEIFKAYDDLGDSVVVVRSSAVGEDGTIKSFAGQYKSILNVTKEKLIQSIKECIASLKTAHASAYSINNPIDKMAVIVQRMIFPNISGVAFSADPVRNNKDILIIESVNGQCELLVSGAVTPDHYDIYRDNINNSDVPKDIKLVAEITLQIENKLGYFVDVEWAIENNNLYVLQARPITTLK